MRTKRRIILALLLVCVTVVSAQTIKKDDKFFDGWSLYTVQEVRMGTIVYMTTQENNELTLEKVGNKPGEYKIIPSRQAEECPIRFAEWNWRVQYIRQNGMNFLAVRKPNGDAMWTMVLTPDDEANCSAQQATLVHAEWSDVIANTLLNTPYLMNIPREQLRLMRNEILARHGYVFQSKDLRDYFSKKWWYKPVADNNSIKLNIVEQTNVQLIKSEEAVEPGLHPADVAGDVERPLYGRPVLLGGERLCQGIENGHVPRPDPHPAGDDPAKIPGLHRAGVMEQVREVLHLLVLGVLAVGPLDRQEALHDPVQGEVFGEQGHLLLVRDEPLRHRPGIPGLDPELLRLLLLDPGGEGYRLQHELVGHAKHLGIEVWMELPLAQVDDVPEVLAVHPAEEFRQDRGHLKTAPGGFEPVEGLGELGIKHVS